MLTVSPIIRLLPSLTQAIALFVIERCRAILTQRVNNMNLKKVKYGGIINSNGDSPLTSCSHRDRESNVSFFVGIFKIKVNGGHLLEKLICFDGFLLS
jgi:hypothetical protein